MKNLLYLFIPISILIHAGCSEAPKKLAPSSTTIEKSSAEEGDAIEEVGLEAEVETVSREELESEVVRMENFILELEDDLETQRVQFEDQMVIANNTTLDLEDDLRLQVSVNGDLTRENRSIRSQLSRAQSALSSCQSQLNQ